MSASDFVEPTKTMVERRDDFLLSLKQLLNLDFCEYFYYLCQVLQLACSHDFHNNSVKLFKRR
jgi:hypothetical protein